MGKSMTQWCIQSAIQTFFLILQWKVRWQQPCAEVWGCSHADLTKEMAFQWSTCSGHSGWGSFPVSLSQPGKALLFSRGEELWEGSRRRLESAVMLLSEVGNWSQTWEGTRPATSSREAGLSVCSEWGEPNSLLTGVGTTHCWNQSLIYGGDSFKPKFPSSFKQHSNLWHILKYSERVHRRKLHKESLNAEKQPVAQEVLLHELLGTGGGFLEVWRDEWWYLLQTHPWWTFITTGWSSGLPCALLLPFGLVLELCVPQTHLHTPKFPPENPSFSRFLACYQGSV